ncbi:MAG: lipopolysaccharide biosynthesis protein [Chitinophagales bacterium]
MKETSRFYSSLSLLIVLNAVVKPIWIFGIDREVQNEVGADAYGLYFSILNLSIVLSFLNDWGLTVFYNRQLASKNELFTGNTGSFIFLKLLFGLFYAAVVFLVAFITGIKRWDIVFYVVLIQVFTSLFVFFRAIITSQQWFFTDAWLSVLDKLMMIVVCVPFLYLPSLSGKITVGTFLLLQMTCTALAMFVALAILLMKKFRFSFKGLWPGNQVLAAAFPFTVVVLLMSCHARIDGFLLERLSGAGEAGKYAGAYRLLDAANMIGFLFASFLLPYLARNQNDGRIAANVVLNIRHLLAVFSITFSCVVVFLAPWIQKILYHHDEAGYAEVLQWCVPALIGYTLVQIYGTVMTATGHIVAFIYITVISVIINILINILLIPSFGARGSCWAALISQFFSGMATIWYNRQKLNIPVDMRSVLIYIFIGTLVCAVLYLGQGWLSNWIIIIVSGVIALLMLWLTKLLIPRNWKISVGQ